MASPGTGAGPEWARPAPMFCPGNRPERFAKALETADAVILDLEDGVPEADKDAAREAVSKAASGLDRTRLIVRVNTTASPAFDADVQMVRDAGYRAVMLPKAERVEQVSLLAGLEVIALCETAAGVLAAERLAAAPEVAALMWGAEDLVASLGGTSSRDAGGAYRDVVRWARSQVLLAGRAAGKAVFDAVYMDLADLEGLQAEATDGAAVGFTGTVCLHPRQVPVVRDAYRPTPAQLDWATRLLAAVRPDGGVVVFEDTMVDGPLIAHARRLVDRAR